MPARPSLLSMDLEVEGFEPYRASLSLYIDRFTDLRALWPEIASDIGAENRQQMESEGQHAGTPYAPLNPVYAAWKRSQVGDKPILFFSGMMKDALTNPKSANFHLASRKTVD